jgi:hypothetical protein
MEIVSSGTLSISKEQSKARARIYREQRKSKLRRRSDRKQVKLNVGDLVLWKVFAINRKAGKHLTPKFKGLLIVVELIPNGSVTTI